MFKKLVAIEPTGMIPSAVEKLHDFAEEVVTYDDIPADKNDIIARIDDADAVLLSYTSTLGKDILQFCTTVKYIGMCCSLYSPESANVDIKYANAKGIKVTGIRDYGDEGVVEYVISALVDALHGFEKDKEGNSTKPWFGQSQEITGLKTGIIGLGKSGGMIADALHFFGAEVSYFSRTKKEEAKEKGYDYLTLPQLLSENDVLFACLNKNTVLLHEEEFNYLGNKKLLFNTGLSPAWEEKPFLKWLAEDNRCYCDSAGALGGEHLISHPHVFCKNVSSGRTKQAFYRLSEKVLANLSEYDGRCNVL